MQCFLNYDQCKCASGFRVSTLSRVFCSSRQGGAEAAKWIQPNRIQLEEICAPYHHQATRLEHGWQKEHVYACECVCLCACVCVFVCCLSISVFFVLFFFWGGFKEKGQHLTSSDFSAHILKSWSTKGGNLLQEKLWSILITEKKRNVTKKEV